MKTNYARLWCLAMASGLLALTSCAQLPSHISVGKKTTVAGTAATFEQCNISVRFTGSPRPLSSLELSAFSGIMTKFSNWEVDTLGYEQYRLAEFAVCICRDYEFSAGEISQLESTMQMNKDVRFIRAYTPPYSKSAVEFESSEKSNGIIERVQMFLPNAAPKCMFLQSVKFEASKSSSSLGFLGTTEAARVRSSGSVGSPPVSEKPKATVAHRLEELGELRRRGLITKEEYEQKREVILQGL